MQSQEYEQSGSMKISLSVHAPKSRTIRVKSDLGFFVLDWSWEPKYYIHSKGIHEQQSKCNEISEAS